MDSVSSTNQVAREWAASGAESGTLVLANFQTGGVGRLGRSWRSPSGSSVLISTIIDLKTEPSKSSRLPIGVACALHRTVATTCSIDEQSTSRASIKWPNDLLLNGKKCAGVLIESINTNGQARYVVGIGINVLQRQFDGDYRYPATSLTAEVGSIIRRVDVLTELVAALDSAVDAIGRDSAHGAPALGNWNDWPDLMRYYRKHLFGLNQPVSFLQTADDNEIRGIFRGVSDHGAFVLESNGSQRELWAGDVMHLDFLG